VAPSFIQKSLFLDLRSAAGDPKIRYKLALAPFNKNFRSVYSDVSATSANDYRHIDLTFARKEFGYEFSRRLADSLLSHAGFEAGIDKMLGSSYFEFVDDEASGIENLPSKYSSQRALGKVYASLAEKDPSFRRYLLVRGIDLDDVAALDEKTMAKTLRKTRSVVIMREYFSRPSRSGILVDQLHARSRKSFALYAGIPSMLALTEGNPRALINLLSPLVSSYKEDEGRATVSEARQADEVQKSIRVMRSLLKTVPIERKGSTAGQGLLWFLDAIGGGLYQGVMASKFNDNPPLSFRVDNGVPNDLLDAIGKALNIGALVYVPDNASEDIISNVRDKRFRLNYLLSAYYKLPLTLDREIKLSKLLAAAGSLESKQMDLLDEA
jgi:hypothetical protein